MSLARFVREWLVWRRLLRRVGLELRLAVRRAKVIRGPVVLGMVLARGGVHVHAADRIVYDGCGGDVVVFVYVTHNLRIPLGGM